MEIKIKTPIADKSLINVTLTQDAQGKWTIKHDHPVISGLDGAILESDVIDLVKKYDRKNLNKYFPMVGFSS